MRTVLLAAALAVAVLVAACESKGEVEIPESPVDTPTLTATGVAAQTTAEAQATSEARTHARATAYAERTAFAASGVPTKAPKATRTPYTPPYKLALISAACNHEYGFIICEGFVENISGRAMENIEAVAVFSDDAGTPISSDSSLVDYDPLLPEQQSPFKIYGDYNPAISKWRIEFKEFFGGTILMRDDRPE